MIVQKKPPYSSSQVDPDKTKTQIDKLLRDYGIDGVQWTTNYRTNEVELTFIVEADIQGVKKHIGIQVSPPLMPAMRKTWDSKAGRYVKVKAPNWAQGMRLLYWWLKAKVESVAYGLTTVEQEFMSEILVKLPSGEPTTVKEILRPLIATERLSQLAALPSGSGSGSGSGEDRKGEQIIEGETIEGEGGTD